MDFREIECGSVDCTYFKEIKFGAVDWINFQNVEFGCVDWTCATWRILVKAVINIRILQNATNFLTS